MLLGTEKVSGGSDLIELDPTTGLKVRTIGSVGFLVNGLEYDQTTGILYATTSTQSPASPDSLIEIDLTTGAGSLIGASGRKVNNPTVNSSGELYGWTEDSDDLVKFDKATGAATVIGNSGVSTRQHGLAFDANDTLFLVNDSGGDIYEMNVESGAATRSNSIGQAHHGDFDPDSGLYYGIQTSPSDSSSPRTLVTADLSSGAVNGTLTSDSTQLHTLSFGGSGDSPVDFSTITLLGADLSSVDLSGVDLTGVDLTDADLTDADLSGANLADATLPTGDLTTVTFSGIDLTDATRTVAADLSGADLTGVDLTNVDLTGVNLAGADLSGVDLTGTNLTDANLSSGDLTTVIFSTVDPTDGSIVAADLSGADRSQWSVNLFQNLTKQLAVGVEVGNFEMKDKDADSNYAQLSLKYVL